MDPIASGCYEVAGKVVAHSILHGGPGFVGLSPAVVKFLSTGSLDEAKSVVSCDDLLDLDLKQLLKEQVRNSSCRQCHEVKKTRVLVCTFNSLQKTKCVLQNRACILFLFRL